MKKLTKESFINKAKEVHHNKYDYSLVEYKNSKAKIKIICPKHGIFEQRPGMHLIGQGCPYCSGRIISKEFVINKAKEVHHNKYDYSLVEYVSCDKKIKIICPKHGIFEQTPYLHINKKQGCPKCAIVKSSLGKENFINKAKEVHHNKYDYSLVEYKNLQTKVKIICPKHGVFEQKPFNHLQKKGCQKCRMSKGEEKISFFLTQNNVYFETQKTFDNLKNKIKLRYDFYIPSKNLLIEYNGEQHYYKTSWFKTYRQFLERKHCDWLKRKYAKDNNINLLIIPFWEFDNIDKILMEKN